MTRLYRPGPLGSLVYESGDDASMFEQAFKRIDDALRKDAGCSNALDYTEQTSWFLFLKYLDGLEQDNADKAALEGKSYSLVLDPQYRQGARLDLRFWLFPRQGSTCLS